MVTGPVDRMHLLEDIAARVRSKGAFPMVLVTSYRMDELYHQQVPAKYDSQTDQASLKLFELLDVMISVEDPVRRPWFATMPPERIAAQSKAAIPLSALLLKRRVRQLNVGNGLTPSSQMVSDTGIPMSTLQAVYERGLNVDYSALRGRCEKVQATLAGNHKVEISSPNGTRLSVDVSDGRGGLSCGILGTSSSTENLGTTQAWLPAGEVYMPLVKGSAEGVLVSPKFILSGKKVGSVRLAVHAGRITGITGPGAAAFKRFYASQPTGKDLISILDFGVNDHVRYPKNDYLNNWVQSGMVTVAFGDDTWVGGDNACGFGQPVHLPDATVKVDGRTLVQAGHLHL